MSTFAQNLSFLLWQQELPRQDWVAKVAELGKCSEARAERLLANGKPNLDELRLLAEGFGRTEEELQFSNLLAESNVNIWQENVLYLLSTLKHGTNGRLAEALGVSAGTVSKWKKREHLPEKIHQQKLREIFELHATDLQEEPLFLSPTPVDTFGRRMWLCERIKEMDGKTLQSLFPALERLLKES